MVWIYMIFLYNQKYFQKGIYEQREDMKEVLKSSLVLYCDTDWEKIIEEECGKAILLIME